MMKQSLFLAALMLLIPLLTISTNTYEQINHTYSMGELVDISDDELTLEQQSALAGARVSTGNWLHHVGGIGADQGTISRVGGNGDLYIAGRVCHGAGTCSAIFGATTIYANNDLFVAKLGTDGAWKWVVQTSGSSSSNYAYLGDLEVDPYGNVYISGWYNGNKNFGTISKTAWNNNDGFVARIADNGNWSWVESMRDYDNGYARGIALDSNQNVYVIGESYLYRNNGNYHQTYFTDSTSSSAGSIYSTCYSWRYNVWLVKYSVAGVYDWADRISDSCNNRYAVDVIADSNDSVIVTGKFDGQLSMQAGTTTSSGSWDIFLAKVNATHNWEWVTHGGGLSDDRPEKLAIDSNDNIIVTGYNSNHASFGTTIILANSGGFVVKALSNGTWEWGTRISPNSHVIEDVAVHSNDNLTVVGSQYITHLNSTGSQQWYESNSQSLYSISLDSNETAYITGYFSGSKSFENFNLISNGSDDLLIWKWDRDRDGDSIADRLDNCGDNSNGNQDDYDGDGPGDVCDADDDNDGFLDIFDNCPQGDMNWTSNASTDRDNDGCQDSGEDNDDDDDGVIDNLDMCHPTGLLNWTSSPTTDHDGDGCNDISEDLDDDNDGTQDSLDLCFNGEINWITNATSDHDSDGCRDLTEDLDDDNDGIIDGFDDCQIGDTGWISNSSTDHDNDGCQDLLEDLDDDGDSALDPVDLCPRGVLNWIRYISADYDDDGCRDSDEDADDDNDNVTDHSDLCYLGEKNWTSSPMTDNDGDGCRDLTEDIDDDNDGITDVNDFCPQGDIGWTSGRVTDHDSDGCLDSTEDNDDDGDGIPDTQDSCDKGMLGWVSNGGSDYDGDGCLDATEDGDDDGDGINDYSDPCPYGEENCATSGTGGNVTIINQYPENSSSNDTEPNQIIQNTTYVNNTYIFVNNTYENETFQNNTNLNQTINEGNMLNETNDEPQANPNSESESLIEMSWVPLIVIILMVLLLFVQALQLVKKPLTPAGPPESMLAEQEMFDDVDYTTKVMQSSDDFSITEEEPLSSDNILSTPESTTPPKVVENPTISDGFEWVEWPEGSGQNHFRAEGTQDDWQPWPVE